MSKADAPDAGEIAIETSPASAPAIEDYLAGRYVDARNKSKRLDPKDKLGFRKDAENEVSDALKDVPSKSAKDLRKKLIKQAKNNKPFAEMRETARMLLTVSNAERLVGDETYSERRRQLSWWLAEVPQDPDRLARYGRMLLDELKVDSHWIESGQHLYSYRLQGKVLWRHERDLAHYYFNEALKADPNHVLALVGLARISYQDTQYRDAELYLKRAMASGEPDAEVLYMLRNIMARTSGQKSGIALDIVKVNRWTVRYGNTVYEYTRSPTAAGSRRAKELGRQATNLMNLSYDYRQRVLEMRSDGARTHDYIGTIAYEMKDWKEAEHAYKRAVELDPDNMNYHTGLANCYARMNDIPRFLEQASYARNKIHTNAGTHLHWAWGQIAKGNYKFATQLLEEAMELGPGDTLPYAYFGVIAEAKGDTKDAIAYYTAAVAMEEAHAKQLGASYVDNTGHWYVSRISRVVELRTRLALLREKSDPEWARMLYAANIALEQSLADRALADEVHRAMLPAPGMNASRRPRQPLFGELMRTNRALLAYSLYQAGDKQAAHPHFKALREYEPRMRADGIKMSKYLRDMVWKSKPVVMAALDTFKRVGDEREIYWWERESRRNFPPTNDWRRNAYQMPSKSR